MAASKSISIVGCGDWGRNIARTLHQLGSLHSIAYVSGHEDAKAREAAQDYNVPLLNLDEALKDASLVGLVIATPPITHFHVAEAALNHRKHILVEKPMVLEMAQNKTLEDLARTRRCVLMVGHLLRYHPAFQRLLQESKYLGNLRFIRTERTNFGKFYPQDNVLYDLGPHDLSCVLALTNAMPLRVYAHETSLVTSGVSDICSMHLTFDRGVEASIYLSRAHPIKTQRITAIYDQGIMVFDDVLPWDKKLAFYSTTFKNPSVPLPSPQYLTVPEVSPLTQELTHFIECIRTGAEPLTTGRDAESVLKIMMKAAP